jgi:hypothetical protein
MAVLSMLMVVVLPPGPYSKETTDDVPDTGSAAVFENQNYAISTALCHILGLIGW